MAGEPWDGWATVEELAIYRGMAKEELASEVTRATLAFLETAGSLSPEVLTRPSSIGRWSVHECIAHCAVWSDYCAEVLRRSLDGTFLAEDFEYGDEDEYNERTAAESARLATVDLLDRIRMGMTAVVDLLRALPQEEWMARDRYRLVVRETLVNHLREHGRQFQVLSESRE